MRVWGARKAAGVGATPGAGNATYEITFRVETTSGDVKIEFNGGSFVGNYSVASNKGDILVDISGVEVGHSGFIGSPPKGIPVTGSATVITDTGDIELAVLPGPY